MKSQNNDKSKSINKSKSKTMQKKVNKNVYRQSWAQKKIGLMTKGKKKKNGLSWTQKKTWVHDQRTQRCRRRLKRMSIDSHEPQKKKLGSWPKGKKKKMDCHGPKKNMGPWPKNSTYFFVTDNLKIFFNFYFYPIIFVYSFIF